MQSQRPSPPKPDPYADARLAAIVESSFDAIISKDLNSVITSWNPAAERLFGYTSEEAIGRSILMLIPDHLRAEEKEIIDRIRLGERVHSYETTRQRKGGEMIAVSLTVSPIKDAKGQIVGASKIARDITAARESERRIRLLMREVNHRVKNQFAVILSMVRETVNRTSDPATLEQRIRDRIMALSRSHDLLVSGEWLGAELADLIREHLAPFGSSERTELSGPRLTLKANAVQHLGMAFHELATNASKYGALRGNAGNIVVRWAINTDDKFELTWEETSIPFPDDKRNEAGRRGFGSVVLQRVTPQSLNGSASFDREPGQLRWILTAPLNMIVSKAAASDETD